MHHNARQSDNNTPYIFRDSVNKLLFLYHAQPTFEIVFVTVVVFARLWQAKIWNSLPPNRRQAESDNFGSSKGSNSKFWEGEWSQIFYIPTLASPLRQSTILELYILIVVSFHAIAEGKDCYFCPACAKRNQQLPLQISSHGSSVSIVLNGTTPSAWTHPQLNSGNAPSVSWKMPCNNFL